MSADEIRAEAIEVIARAEFARFCKTATWDEVDESDRATWIPNAEALVDALAAAGLLPVEAVRRAAYAVLDTSDEHLVEQLVTDWRAVAE
ncbi:hypothetical protein [Nocardia sp. NPDC003963]